VKVGDGSRTSGETVVPRETSAGAAAKRIDREHTVDPAESAKKSEFGQNGRSRAFDDSRTTRPRLTMGNTAISEPRSPSDEIVLLPADIFSHGYKRLETVY